MIKRSLAVKLCVQSILMSVWDTKDIYNCIVEAQVMLVLFSLLLHVTNHAFYEDYYV